MEKILKPKGEDLGAWRRYLRAQLLGIQSVLEEMPESLARSYEWQEIETGIKRLLRLLSLVEESASPNQDGPA